MTAATASAAPTAMTEIGEDPTTRTAYVATCLVCMLILAAMLGSRTHFLHPHKITRLSLTRILVLVMYVLAICFMISAGILESGFGLETQSICYSAIIICLVFYVGEKIIMYIFLLERAHVLREPYVCRTRDWTWLAGMLVIVIGFSAIAITAFIFPIAQLSPEDGKCRIGLPMKVTIPLLAYDITINIALTAVFVFTLSTSFSFTPPEIEARKWPKVTTWWVHVRNTRPRLRVGSIVQQDYSSETAKAIRWLAWKSVIGTALVLLPTMANLGFLFYMRGSELGWLCFTICSLDVTWGVCIVHWLTVDPLEAGGMICLIHGFGVFLGYESSDSAQAR